MSTVRIAGQPVTPWLAVRYGLGTLAAVLIGYLALIAAWPQLRDALPAAVRWFGAPNSAVSIAIVVSVLILLGVSLSRDRGSGAPVAIVAGLATVTEVLGVASYWRCQDEAHPDFFPPLLWTAALVKGGDPVKTLAGGSACPASPMPVALHIAQISALAALFMSVVGVAVALFRTRGDRLRVRLARSVTAVIGIDEDTRSLVTAIERTLRDRSALVVVTDDPESADAQHARAAGARVLAAQLDTPQGLSAVPIWHKLDRLYLVAADPSTNLLRLRTISARGGDDRQRIPLIVRIDDPWQAASWRAQHFGGAHNRWAADTVGAYEVTARRLLDRILAGARVDRLLVCGSSPLTTAICSDMLQRRLEFEYSGTGWLPEVSVVADDADDYVADYTFAAGQLGHPDRGGDITAIPEDPSFATLLDKVTASEPARTALIMTAGCAAGGAATRLAARLPDTTIHCHDPRADVARERLAVIGRLYTFRCSMDMPGGHAQDAWERAAALIHNRYVADAGPAAPTWAQLDDFYRESNRRQVRNALWMVERIGGHSWNCWGTSEADVCTAELRGLQPAEQLQALGFDRPTAIAMARAEHEDWCRYYRRHGWRHGTRDDTAKRHDKLVDWAQIETEPAHLEAALRSLAATLTKLRELGYRSQPCGTAWAPFRRRGAVLAEQRSRPWTWTAHDGSTMRAEAGDWAVREENGESEWSVRDSIFRATHEPIGNGRWRRLGTVLARPAHTDESVDTLEGTLHATAGSWIVQGDHGDVWAVPGDEFERRYRGTDRSNAGGK